MGGGEVRCDAEALESFVSRLFHSVGVDTDDSRYAAQCLVQADLWGKDSHGVMRAPQYLRRLRSGALNPTPKLAVVQGGGALQVIDGGNGLGFVAGRDAMLRAVALAETHGVGAVGVRNSSHFGAAALYARLAVDSGMVGIAMANSFAKVAAPGGSKAITGSNPVAVGVPTHGDFPFVLDVSMSAVAGGRLLVAAERGEKIPTDWAIDADGLPTDDPVKAFAGSYLPLGGVKGLGLSYAVDILSGLITGAAFGLGIKSLYSSPAEPSGTGHMMIAMNLETIIGREELRARMAEFCADIKSSPMRDEGVEMLIPGERAHRIEQQRRGEGIPLTAELHRALLALGEELGVRADALVKGGRRGSPSA
jgi:L-2-hydroxycarboxylate dehydrogenase (NAD+)